MGTVARTTEALEKVGMEIPFWSELSEGARPDHTWPRERDPTEPQHGWQKVASTSVHEHYRSQSGPLASVPLTALPVHRVSRMDSEPFRVVLLRRLRMPLPLSVRRCCRGFAVENAVAQMCREGGARVSTNIFVRDLDLDLAHVSTDGRRLEVVAEGLSLFGGSQLAVDATLVSALHGNGIHRRNADKQTASPCEKHADTRRGLIPSFRAGTVACGWW